MRLRLTTLFAGLLLALAGLAPLHGSVSNSVIDPEGRSGGAWYWFARDVRVPSLVSAARARWLKTATVSWPVSVGIGSDLNVPEFWRPGSQHPIDRQLLVALSTPGLLDAVAIERGRPLPWPMTEAERVTAGVFTARRPRLRARPARPRGVAGARRPGRRGRSRPGHVAHDAGGADRRPPPRNLAGAGGRRADIRLIGGSA